VHSTTQFIIIIIIIIIIIMTPKDTYLIVYNVCCCVGWSNIFALSILSLSKGIPQDGWKDALANMYHSSTEYLGVLLFYTQLAAVLEIVHAGVGLVRSPVLVTAMQVSSRLWALVAVTYSPNAQCKVEWFL
jgi:very-long-chain (3R)-3-hydroxyacyl-CoA dehydratase